MLSKFSKERKWEKNYHPNHLALSIAIESAELLEQFQWKDIAKSYEAINSKAYRKMIAFEIIDVLYYLLMLSNIMDIDIETYAKLKLKNLAKRYPKLKV